MKNEDKAQFNLRMPAGALREINRAGLTEGKSTADYLRIAGLIAACHTFRDIPMTVFVAAGERMTLVRAQALGMTPVAEVGAKWEGEVRVTIGKNGLYQDQAGGVWALTSEGLKQMMGFDPVEEAQRLAALSKVNGLESRSPYRVTQPFTAHPVKTDEATAPADCALKQGSTLFADADYWKGKLREGEEIVQFYLGGTTFYVGRRTFLNSTQRTPGWPK